jgi:hypothetical protein
LLLGQDWNGTFRLRARSSRNVSLPLRAKQHKLSSTPTVVLRLLGHAERCRSVPAGDGREHRMAYGLTFRLELQPLLVPQINCVRVRRTGSPNKSGGPPMSAMTISLVTLIAE